MLRASSNWTFRGSQVRVELYTEFDYGGEVESDGGDGWIVRINEVYCALLAQEFGLDPLSGRFQVIRMVLAHEFGHIQVIKAGLHTALLDFDEWVLERFVWYVALPLYDYVCSDTALDLRLWNFVQAKCLDTYLGTDPALRLRVQAMEATFRRLTHRFKDEVSCALAAVT